MKLEGHIEDSPFYHLGQLQAVMDAILADRPKKIDWTKGLHFAAALSMARAEEDHPLYPRLMELVDLLTLEVATRPCAPKSFHLALYKMGWHSERRAISSDR